MQGASPATPTPTPAPRPAAPGVPTSPDPRGTLRTLNAYVVASASSPSAGGSGSGASRSRKPLRSISSTSSAKRDGGTWRWVVYGAPTASGDAGS